MAAVDEHGELHALRTAVVEDRLDRRSDRAARVEDVVDQDDGLALEGKVEPGRLDDGLRVGPLLGAKGDVVAVEGDVEGAGRDARARVLLDQVAQPLGQGRAPGVDADEPERGEVGMLLDDLMGDPAEGALERFLVEQHALGRGDVHPSCSFPASQGAD